MSCNSSGTWQAEAEATASKTWAVLSGLRGVVINEVLTHTDLPEGQIESYRQGWEAFYFKPMREYFAKR